MDNSPQRKQLTKDSVQIAGRYHTQEAVPSSTAYGDGWLTGDPDIVNVGPHGLQGRLLRAVGNLVEEDQAMFSRLGIWANTVRELIQCAVDDLRKENADAESLMDL